MMIKPRILSTSLTNSSSAFRRLLSWEIVETKSLSVLRRETKRHRSFVILSVSSLAGGSSPPANLGRLFGSFVVFPLCDAPFGRGLALSDHFLSLFRLLSLLSLLGDFLHRFSARTLRLWSRTRSGSSLRGWPWARTRSRAGLRTRFGTRPWLAGSKNNFKQSSILHQWFFFDSARQRNSYLKRCNSLCSTLREEVGHDSFRTWTIAVFQGGDGSQHLCACKRGPLDCLLLLG